MKDFLRQNGILLVVIALLLSILIGVASAFLGGNQPLCVIRNENVPDGGKLLLVRDSYSDALAPFLAQRFSEVHLMDLRYYRMPAARYAAENGIDDIVVLYSVPNFLTDKNLVFLGQ